MSQLKAIFFDAGGTLLSTREPPGCIYAEVARKYGCHISVEVIDQRFREVWGSRNEIGNSTNPSDLLQPGEERRFWTQVVHDVFDPVASFPDFDAFVEELHDLFLRKETWKVFPEVPEVLIDLRKKGLKLAIVSNWDSRLPDLCDLLGLTPFFDHIAVSSLVGMVKPAPGIFLSALRAVGVSPSETIHVGDLLVHDVEGARGVGIKGILLNRGNHHVADGVPTIHSLRELSPYLS